MNNQILFNKSVRADSCNLPFLIFSYNNLGTPLGVGGCISNFNLIYDQVSVRHLIPFYRNGVYGMLNISDGGDFNHFYLNANSVGQFELITENSDTPPYYEWMVEAYAQYSIPLDNLMAAYKIDNNIEYSFTANRTITNTSKGWLC